MPTATIAEPADAQAPAVTSPSATSEEVQAPPAPGSATREISRATARRYLAHHHFLAPPRSLPPGADGILAVFDRLGSIQFDPIDVAGRNHDLVLLSRVPSYRRDQADALLHETRALYETYNKGLSLVPTAELPWYRVTWDRVRRQHEGGTFDEHAQLVEELLARIRDGGPMSSIDVEPRAAIEWYWRPTNQVRAILEALGEAGILGLARRDGNRRVYDLVERLFPAEILEQRVPVRDQFRHKLLSRYRAHGLLGMTGSAELWMSSVPWAETGHEDGLPPKSAGRRVLVAELLERGDLVPVAVEGVRGLRYVPATEIARLDAAEHEVRRSAPVAAPGVAFVAALDPLAWDRDLLRSLYDFDYLWEVYVPAAKRRWGYYVLPIHFGDRLVGRIEPRLDRKTDTLRIAGLWWEDGFDPLEEPGFVEAFSAAVDAHRAFGGVHRLAWPRTSRHRELGKQVRARLDRRPAEV